MITTTGMNNLIITDALDSMPGGVFIYKANENEDILYINNYVLDIFECSSLEEFMYLTKGSFKSLVHPEDLSAVEASIASQIAGGSDHFDHVSYRIKTAKGNIRQIEDFGRKVSIEGVGEVFYVFIVDNDIKYLTYDIDRMTGLPGARRFYEYASRLLKLYSIDPSAPTVAFLYFDITKFKLFNVKFGVEEGDQLLIKCSKALKESFPDSCIARFSDDHFVVMCDNVNLEEKIEDLYSRLTNYKDNVKLDGKVGIYFTDDYKIQPQLACDFAKIACDYIKHDNEKHYQVYTEDIAENLRLDDYIINHFDQALEKKHIHVYYQPVVRALSKALCGFEALTRWIDPIQGFMNPAKFIDTLERTHQIHKLDIYMIREICRNYRERVDNNEPVVPVSVNLSRLDFMLCDITNIIDEITAEYNVPHDMLNIEITESTFIEDAGLIGKAIDDLHKRGYQVWMDDFGSGYSSLNILKDFSFDELKIDMVFLSSFTKKSRDILEASVRMAKQIGIQTLAEGVETQEQYEFLRSIGCEKIQGYFFGKPAPYDDSIQNILDHNLTIESMNERIYYDKVGKINFLTDKPLAIIEDTPAGVRFMFVNDAYKEALKISDEITLSDKTYTLEENSSSNIRTREFLESAKKSKDPVSIVYPNGNNLMHISARLIASTNDHYMIEASLINISGDRNKELESRIDLVTSHLLYLYDEVFLLNLEEDYVEVFADSLENRHSEILRYNQSLKESLENYAKNTIAPKDLARFHSFVDATTLDSRIKESNKGYIGEYFMTKQPNGEYSWMIHTIVDVPKSNGKMYIALVTKAAFEDVKNKDALFDRVTTVTSNNEDDLFSGSNLWKNLENFTHVNFFWKDKERRFVGASTSFLQFFGLDSIDSIKGKTDEDIGWHIYEEPYKKDELAILNTGAHINGAPGKCIIKGVVHNIAAYKTPVYKDGKIVGIMGYFVDTERMKGNLAKLESLSTTDLITDLCNVRGLIESIIAYDEEYRLHHKDFTLMKISIDEYNRFMKVYDEEAANKLLRKIAQTLLSLLPTNATIGRILDEFIIIYRHDRTDITSTITSSLESIIQIEDYRCTIKPEISSIKASECQSFEEMMSSIVRLI